MAVVAEADKLRQQRRRRGRLWRGRAAFRDAAAHQRCCHRSDPRQFHQVHAPSAARLNCATRLSSATRRISARTTSAKKSIASTGGKHALFNAIQVLVDHGDEVILPVPYWVSFKDIVRYAGGNRVFLETDESAGFRVTAEMVARADHAAHQGHHSEFADQSVGRGDEPART